ncbi:Neurensin-1, partial [Stegodyphus mimosarum]
MSQEETEKAETEASKEILLENEVEKQKSIPSGEKKKVKNGRNKMKLDLKKKINSTIPRGNSKDETQSDYKTYEIGETNAADSEKSQCDTKDEASSEFFGVRSYLHNFYESVSIRNPQLYEDIYEDDMLYLSQTRKQRKAALFCWKFNLAMGAFTLALGLFFILVGYITPLRQGIAGQQEGFLIIDRDAARFNYYIKLCRIMGLIVFCIGGCIFCFTMLLSVFFNIHYSDDEDETPVETFCVTLTAEDVPQSPTDKKIPATEELTSVQPKREVDEVVMTNAGLCKPP